MDYEPGESSTGLFGGNSNWRGPIWFPVNYLLVESLQKFHHYFGESFRVECPTGSGQLMTLAEVAAEISRRLGRIFLLDEQGRRPVFGGEDRFQNDAEWRDYVPFHEYFHGDTGRGVGASTRPAGPVSSPSCSSKAGNRVTAGPAGPAEAGHYAFKAGPANVVSGFSRTRVVRPGERAYAVVVWGERW